MVSRSSLADSGRFSAAAADWRRGAAARSRAFISSPSDSICNERGRRPSQRRHAGRGGRRRRGSRGISNINSKRAPGPIGKLVGERFEWLARLAVDADNQDFSGRFIATVRQTRGRGAARRSLTRAPRRASSFNGAAAPLAKTISALAPASPANGRIGVKSSSIRPLASKFQSESTTAASRSTSGAYRLVDDNRAE